MEAKLRKAFKKRRHQGMKWSGTSFIKFRPQTKSLDQLPLELQRLLYSSDSPMIAEVWDVFNWHTTFKLRGYIQLQHETLESFGLYQFSPTDEFRPTAWIRKVIVNLDTTFSVGDGYPTFLRRLLSCPSLRTIQIDLGVDADQYYGPMNDSHLHKIAKTFITMAKAYTELQIKFGRNLKLGIVGQAVRGRVIVPRMDLSWLFPPMDGATNLYEPPDQYLQEIVGFKIGYPVYTQRGVQEPEQK
ncbi:hypothetical protein OEA41_009834 [Lepraria neglecta]|uniref:Uncharacterized protein n=1 Tax=Lepraria neglecta TaxID=209136 RepID=A0AAD9YV93_9LECA|nr:hypothetical protein OEA41_009834 [Lepraria neglecta]